MHGVGGQSDNRDLLVFGIVANDTSDLETVHSRKLDVHQNEFGGGRLEGVEGCLPARLLDDPVSGGPKKTGKQPHARRIVFHDHNQLAGVVRA